MPRDEDEDVEDARPLPGRPSGAPPKPAGPAALAWGVCGVSNTPGDLTAFPGDAGVIRLVKGGVGYTVPPVPTVWKPVPAEAGRYEMPWPGDPAAARTLRALRTDLERAARAGQFTDPEHPLLAELDEAAAALVATVGRLHRAGWSVGILQPDNVLLRGRPGGREAVPVDLGFTWRGSFGAPPWDDSPGRPEWLEPTVTYRWLWDHDPVRQQFAAPDGGAFPPTEPASDLRVIGRLFAWLLSGQTSPSPPAVGGPGGPPPAWAVVADAANGRVESTARLASRLQAAPLSEYFAPLPEAADEPGEPKSGGGGKAGLIVAALVLLAAAGGGAWWYLNRNKDRSAEPDAVATGPAPTRATARATDKAKPPVKGDPAAFAKLAALFGEKLKAADVRGLLAALPDLSAAAPAEKGPEVAVFRKAAFERWTTAVTNAVTEGNDPSRRNEVTDRLNVLIAELRHLIQTTPASDPDQQMEEEKWLADVSLLAQQFGQQP